MSILHSSWIICSTRFFWNLAGNQYWKERQNQDQRVYELEQWEVSPWLKNSCNNVWRYAKSFVKNIQTFSQALTLAANPMMSGSTSTEQTLQTDKAVLNKPASHHDSKRLLKPFSIYQASMFKRFGASRPTFTRPASIANSSSWWVPWSKGFPWMGNWFWQRLDRIGFCQTYGMPKYSQRWENIHARPHQKWGLDIMFPK